jgi:hypothetical protein
MFYFLLAFSFTLGLIFGVVYCRYIKSKTAHEYQTNLKKTLANIDQTQLKAIDICLKDIRPELTSIEQALYILKCHPKTPAQNHAFYLLETAFNQLIRLTCDWNKLLELEIRDKPEKPDHFLIENWVQETLNQLNEENPQESPEIFIDLPQQSLMLKSHKKTLKDLLYYSLKSLRDSAKSHHILLWIRIQITDETPSLQLLIQAQTHETTWPVFDSNYSQHQRLAFDYGQKGLWIDLCHELAKKLNGQALFQCNQTLKFAMNIPVELANADLKPQPHWQILRNKKLALFDQNPISQKLLDSQLQSYGIIVSAEDTIPHNFIQNEQDAWQFKPEYDFIFLDRKALEQLQSNHGYSIEMYQSTHIKHQVLLMHPDNQYQLQNYPKNWQHITKPLLPTQILKLLLEWEKSSLKQRQDHD